MKNIRFGSSLFIVQNYFINDTPQNALIFQPIFDSFAMPPGHTETIITWKSKGLWNDVIKLLTTANYRLSQKLKWHNSKMGRKLLKRKQNNFTPSIAVKLIYCLWIK